MGREGLWRGAAMERVSDLNTIRSDVRRDDVDSESLLNFQLNEGIKQNKFY